MEIVLNDYSLNGQFNSVDEFTLWIYQEWIKMFDYLLEKKIALYKKSDFYSKYITKDKTISDLFQMTGDPIITKIRTFIINSAYSEPYWDKDGVIKTDLSNTYSCINDDDLPNCFSEAIERDKVIVSIKNEEFLEKIFLCYKNGNEELLDNIVEYNAFLIWLLDSKISDIKYIFENYRFNREIHFAEIHGKCYAKEAIENNSLTKADTRNILFNISELINGLSTGTKNRFWDNIAPGIFEYRVTISNSREFRLFFTQDKAIYFLNGFIKKEQKTPKYHIDKAKEIINALNK